MSEEIKDIIGAFALTQIKELKRFIESRRIKLNEVAIFKWYLHKNYTDEGMQAIAKLFEYFFILGGRYLHISSDEQNRLVFEFRDESGWHKKHYLIIDIDKIIYREITSGLGKVLDWEVEFIPVVKAKNKVVEKAPAW